MFISVDYIIEGTGDEKLPIVPLPSKEELERRKLLTGYSRVMKKRTKDINLLRYLSTKVHTTIVEKNLATDERRREAVKVYRRAGTP